MCELKFITGGSLATPAIVLFEKRHIHRETANLLEVLTYGELSEWHEAGFAMMYQHQKQGLMLAFGGFSESMGVGVENAHESPFFNTEWRLLRAEPSLQLILNKAAIELIDPEELQATYPQHQWFHIEKSTIDSISPTCQTGPSLALQRISSSAPLSSLQCREILGTSNLLSFFI